MTRGPLVVVGDVMLDVDVEGTAERLSPEAPVPVVDVRQEWHRPGGAGLAAVLAARHEADVVLVAGFCADEPGRALRKLLADSGVDVIALPMTGSTVVKTRIRAHGQSVLRMDEGTARVQPDGLPEHLVRTLSTARAVCVADYGGGVTALPELRELLSRLAGRLPIIWDPHPRGCTPVPGCTLVTPNEAEAQHFRGVDSPSALRQRWRAAALCVTLGSRGVRLYGRDGDCSHIAVPRLDAAATVRPDVCGAGDRFAIAVAAALSGGADVPTAVEAAVEAAARFVSTGGAGAVSSPASRDTPARPDELDVDATAFADELRGQGRTVVATGGCFDLLHTGHVSLLRRARQLGDGLVVLINSDESVRRLKGSERPVVPAADRARVVGALSCVDAVAVFDEDTPERALEAIRPDVWVKGGDYSAAEMPEAAVVVRHGGRVVVLPTVAGYSSSRIIAAIGSPEQGSMT